MLWSYDLGQVWPVAGLLSGPSWVLKRLCIKNTIKVVVSAHFKEVQLQGQISGAIIWAKFPTFVLRQSWPR